MKARKDEAAVLELWLLCTVQHSHSRCMIQTVPSLHYKRGETANLIVADTEANKSMLVKKVMAP